MVRQRVMRLGDADLRIRPAGLLAAVHERDHPRQIGLVGQQLQVVEQPHVRLEPIRNTGRLSPRRGPAWRSVLPPSESAVPRHAATRDSRSPSCCRPDRVSAEAAARGRSPNRECCGPGGGATRARADPCCRSIRTAARRPRAGCFPPSAAASASATTACCCRRSCSPRHRTPPGCCRPRSAAARTAASRARTPSPRSGPSRCRSRRCCPTS